MLAGVGSRNALERMKGGCWGFGPGLGGLGGGLTLLLVNRIKHIWRRRRRKFLLHDKRPSLVDPPPTTKVTVQGKLKAINLWQSSCHNKTVSIHNSPFSWRHTIQCEQLTHTLNMTLRNTQNIGAKENFFQVTWKRSRGGGFGPGGGGGSPSHFFVLMRVWLAGAKKIFGRCRWLSQTFLAGVGRCLKTLRQVS